MIVGYRYEAGNTILTKVVHEELTGESVANFMTVPRDVSDLQFILIGKLTCCFDSLTNNLVSLAATG